jgi:TRAP-type mannitol/chloroaromatic compound transport system permease small subunit
MQRGDARGMKHLALLVRSIDRFNATVGRAASCVILVMIAIVMFEVIRRYGFRAPTQWANELTTYVFAGYIFLGAGYTLLHRDHVNMDVVYANLPKRVQAGLDILTAGFAFLYCYVLISTGWESAWSAYLSGRTTGTDWNPPLFPALVLLPIGAALLMLQLLAKLVRDIVYALTGRDLTEEPRP